MRTDVCRQERGIGRSHGRGNGRIVRSVQRGRYRRGHGHKNIEDIEVGDLVLAYDEETGETAYKPVVTLFRNTTKEWFTVSVRGNDGELYEITSTPGHKYFVPGNRVRKDSRALEHASYAGLSEKWVSACDLKRGDKVLLSDGTLCEVEGVSCKKLSVPETTYNLEVADFHTYYVSDACVLVHNADCGGQLKFANRGSTGRTQPNSLVEKLAMEQVRSNPLDGAKVLSKIKLNDKRWLASDGWLKMQRVVRSGTHTTKIHFNYNPMLKLVDDFKFVV